MLILAESCSPNQPATDTEGAGLRRTRSQPQLPASDAFAPAAKPAFSNAAITCGGDRLAEDGSATSSKSSRRRKTDPAIADTPLLFARAAYHLGNRHVPVQIVADRRRRRRCASRPTTCWPRWCAAWAARSAKRKPVPARSGAFDGRGDHRGHHPSRRRGPRRPCMPRPRAPLGAEDPRVHRRGDACSSSPACCNWPARRCRSAYTYSQGLEWAGRIRGDRPRRGARRRVDRRPAGARHRRATRHRWFCPDGAWAAGDSHEIRRLNARTSGQPRNPANCAPKPRRWVSRCAACCATCATTAWPVAAASPTWPLSPFPDGVGRHCRRLAHFEAQAGRRPPYLWAWAETR